MPTTVARAIYSGMGIADDPDVNDYYTRVRGFPITNDDPEVVEEMRIVAAELKKGGDNSKDEAMEDSSESLSDNSDGVASGRGKGGAEEDWVDKNENAEKLSAGPSKRNKKTLLSVEKYVNHTV